jgi:hypothetical protein
LPFTLTAVKNRARRNSAKCFSSIWRISAVDSVPFLSRSNSCRMKPLKRSSKVHV